MSALIRQNVATVEQGIALVERLSEMDSWNGLARIAPHFRHCIDFYNCFFAGFSARRIDYDERDRSPELESNLRLAAQELGRIRDRLTAFDPERVHDVVEVRAEATSEDMPWVGSTATRELLFLLSHTVHHYALIAFVLDGEGVELPSGFGVAPSTLEHARSGATCAP